MHVLLRRDVRLNVEKSRYMALGPGARIGESVCYRDAPLPTSLCVRYLGVDIRAGTRFVCDIEGRLKSFYRAANALLHKSSMVGIARSQDLLFFLYQRYCVPILRYGYDVMLGCLLRRDENRMKVAHNSMVRRIYGIDSFDSVPVRFSFATCMGLPL